MPQEVFSVSDSELGSLRLSVDTHAKSRPLSPEQVATGIQRLLSLGHSRAQIAELLGFSGTTMIGRFLKVLEIPEHLRYRVGWGSADEGAIAFSSVPYIVRLPNQEQDGLTVAAVKHRLTRLEIQSVVQLFERSGEPLENCVGRVVKRRSQVIALELIFGSIDAVAQKKISGLGQLRRDEALATVIRELAPNLADFQARLGSAEYMIAGRKGITDQLQSKLPRISEELVQYVTEMRDEGR